MWCLNWTQHIFHSTPPAKPSTPPRWILPVMYIHSSFCWPWNRGCLPNRGEYPNKHLTSVTTWYSRGLVLVQWLKLPGGKVGDRGFKPHSGLQVPKKQNISFPLTRKYSILCGACVTERQRARPQTARAQISNPVSGGQCHLVYLTILRRFSWPSLAYMCTYRWPKTPFI